MKGGKQMTCEHKRIKSVNCVLFCMDCGAQLPADFQTGNHPSEPDKAAETPENGQKKRSRKKV